MLDTDEERTRARLNIEVGIMAALKSCADDATATIEHINGNDLAPATLTTLLEDVCRAADMVRHVRELAESEIRSSAIEWAVRLAEQ